MKVLLPDIRTKQHLQILTLHVHLRNYASGQEELGLPLAEHFAREIRCRFYGKSVDTIGMFMGAVYAGCFYVLLDTKQPAARISQILDILDSNVIVTSSKYQKDLEKLEFKGTILLTEELEKHQKTVLF